MNMILARIKNAVKESGILPSFKVREKLASRYLHGEGLEIGALHLPLKAPRGVKVSYVDIATREENIRRFPELDASRIVETDHVENGFELAGIAGASQDFLIANHVLEHADNPLRVLLNWGRVLRPQGIMMVTVPMAAASFDKGRGETPLEHFIDDYRLDEAGEKVLFRERNREHMAEWLGTAAPRVARMRGDEMPPSNPEGLARMLEEMCKAEKIDIHFHTFSRASFTRLLDCFATDIHGGFRLMEVCRSRGGSEVVAIMKKLH